jgi:hypothetical protein
MNVGEPDVLQTHLVPLWFAGVEVDVVADPHVRSEVVEVEAVAGVVSVRLEHRELEERELQDALPAGQRLLVGPAREPTRQPDTPHAERRRVQAHAVPTRGDRFDGPHLILDGTARCPRADVRVGVVPVGDNLNQTVADEVGDDRQDLWGGGRVDVEPVEVT